MSNNIAHSILQHVPQYKVDSMIDQIKDKLFDYYLKRL